MVEPEAVGTEVRREQLLRAALEVITERGFADTRVADVAERAGTSPGLVIYYFKTKDRLLTEAIRYCEDTWYDVGTARIATLESAAQRLERLVAMTCLPEDDDQAVSWVLWLDLWSQAARHAEVAAVRKEFDLRWQHTIAELVREGQRAGEFGPVDAEDFAVLLSCLLDGFAIQIALHDDVVDPRRAFRACMRLAADQLGFKWGATGGAARARRSARR